MSEIKYYVDMIGAAIMFAAFLVLSGIGRAYTAEAGAALVCFSAFLASMFVNANRDGDRPLIVLLSCGLCIIGAMAAAFVFLRSFSS